MHEIRRRRIKNLKTGVVMDGLYDTLTGRFTPDGASTSLQVLYTEWAVNRIPLELPTEDGVYAVASWRHRLESAYIYRLGRGRWQGGDGGHLDDTQMGELRMHHENLGLVRLSATGPTLGGPQD